MKGGRAAAYLSLALLVATTGCASGGFGGRPDPAAEELAELQRRVLDLQRQTTVNEVEIERLRRTIADLEARLDRLGGNRPEDAAASMREAPARKSPPPGERPAAPARRDEPPLIEEVELEAKPVAATPPRTSPPPQAPPPAAAQELYDQGYALYHQGRYLDAEASFQRFLQNHDGTELADNALFWIGEARWARGDLQGALAAFRETVERYPKGNKVPDALLKAGQSFEALGDRESARTTYQEVLRRFEGTPAADVAQDRLQALP